MKDPGTATELKNVNGIARNLSSENEGTSYKVAGNGQYFGELSFLSQGIRYGCFYSSPYWISIVFYEYHVVRVKPRRHVRARHLVPYNQSLLLLSFDSQKNLVSYFANSSLVIHVDAFWWPVVRRVPQGAVVHHSHTSKFLYCSACRGDTGKKQERIRERSPQ